jgi:DNA-binding GntR family transcriptional regulator
MLTVDRQPLTNKTSFLMFQPLKKFNAKYPVPLSDQVAGFLRNAIIQGSIEEGQRLVENELQRELGISRGPIREAFRKLEKDDLIVIVPRKGTFVRKINRKDVLESLTLRALLEGYAARLAIDHMEEDISKMESTFRKMKEAIKEKDYRSYLQHHYEYHSIFINASKNDTLVGILKGLRIQGIWYRFLYDYVQETFEYGISVHRKILSFFIRKDADRLEGLVREHILRVHDWFLQSSRMAED